MRVAPPIASALAAAMLLVELHAQERLVAAARLRLAERVIALTRDSSWRRISAVTASFRTFHPQGMVKIDETLFVSAVEVRVPTRRLTRSPEGYDRDAGEGVGHLFKMDLAGRLLAEITLGQGSIYHPGGIDYDGRSIWIPVAEYRPNSRSIVYRVDPATMKTAEVLRVADHIGAVAYDTDDHALHGVSWGSRRFYRWLVEGDERIMAGELPQPTLNVSHYVDYQDCKYAGAHRMLCTGVTELRQAPEARPFRLGGIELVDLRNGRPIHQVPMLLWTTDGLDLTHNPVWLEATATGIRGYFMPDDERSTLYVYDVETDVPR
jgi:uncharacterized protein DUF6454